MLASAMSSSSTGAWPLHSARRCARIRQVSPMRSRYCTAGRWTIDAMDACIARAHMWSTRLGQLVEGRVAVDLVFHRVEVHRLVGRVAGDDLVGAHDPDAGAFLAPRVDVARHLDRHLRIGRVQAAAVLVVEAGLAAHEHFPQRPFVLRRRGVRRSARPDAARCRRPRRSRLGSCRLARQSCLRACASAASRTHAPSSHAFTRAARRSRLHGPLPLTTCQNSPQSIGAEVVVLALLVPLQVGVGQRHAQHLGLLDGRRRRTSGAVRRWRCA